MELLITGMIIFFGVHLIPVFKCKQSIINRLGKKPYMGIFALISALGLGLMIYGKGQAEFIPLWQPLAWNHWVPIIVMWPTAVIFVWAEIPCSMKTRLRHPMLLGIVLFTASHLFANGDLATVLLFASFGIYAIFTMLRLGFAKPQNNLPDSTPGWNVIGILGGTLAYILVFTFHQNISGMPIPVGF